MTPPGSPPPLHAGGHRHPPVTFGQERPNRNSRPAPAHVHQSDTTAAWAENSIPEGQEGGTPEPPKGPGPATPRSSHETLRPACCCKSTDRTPWPGFRVRGQQERERLPPRLGGGNPGEGRLLLSAPTGRARARQLGPAGTGSQRWKRPCQRLRGEEGAGPSGSGEGQAVGTLAPVPQLEPPGHWGPLGPGR